MTLIMVIITLISPTLFSLININPLRRWLFNIDSHSNLTKRKYFDYFSNLLLYGMLSFILYKLLLSRIKLSPDYVVPIIGSIFVIINFLYKYQSDHRVESLNQFENTLHSIESFVLSNSAYTENLYNQITEVNRSTKKLTLIHSLKLSISSNFIRQDSRMHIRRQTMQVTDTDMQEIISESKQTPPETSEEKLLLVIFNIYIAKHVDVDFLKIISQKKYNDVPLLTTRDIQLLQSIRNPRNLLKNKNLQPVYGRIQKIIEARIDRTRFNNLQKDLFIVYNAHYILINKIFDSEDYSVLFKLIHRNIKIINHLNLSVYEERILIARIRAILPEKLIYILYYNCSYSNKGFGLGKILIGSDFFGNKNDLHKTSQHFETKKLLHRKNDFNILINFFGASVYPGDVTHIKKYNNIFLITHNIATSKEKHNRIKELLFQNNKVIW